jgi:hypothetical protein
MAKRRNVHTYEFEVEHGGNSVSYVAEFTVSPAEPERGPSYSSAGEPGCAAEVEDVEVFYVLKGKGGKTLKERRPELDEIVDHDTLLEFVAEEDDGPDPDDARDAAMDREYDRRSEED